MLHRQLDGERYPVRAEFIPGDRLARSAEPFSELFLCKAENVAGFLEISRPHVTNRYMF